MINIAETIVEIDSTESIVLANNVGNDLMTQNLFFWVFLKIFFTILGVAKMTLSSYSQAIVKELEMVRPNYFHAANSTYNKISKKKKRPHLIRPPRLKHSLFLFSAVYTQHTHTISEKHLFRGGIQVQAYLSLAISPSLIKQNGNRLLNYSAADENGCKFCADFQNVSVDDDDYDSNFLR